VLAAVLINSAFEIADFPNENSSFLSYFQFAGLQNIAL